MIGIHDNTAANKRNPDPNMWVGFGERSVDDMLQVWINIVYLDEPEYTRLVEERRAKQATATTERSSPDVKRTYDGRAKRQAEIAAGSAPAGAHGNSMPAQAYHRFVVVAALALSHAGLLRPIGRQERRVADLRRRPRAHALRAARPDQRRQLQQARGRVAVQDRQPRAAAGVQASSRRR